MKKILLFVLAVILTFTLFAGCQTTGTKVVKPEEETKKESATPPSSSEAPADVKKLVISSDFPPTHNWVQMYKELADIVKEKTNGGIEMQVFDSAALGSQREALEGMLVGTVNGTIALEPISYWVKDIDIFGIPYLFKDETDVEKFMEGPLGAELVDKVIAAGFQPITYFLRPPREISSNKPINTVDDLKGIKIRVPETKTGPAAFEAMGAKAITLPFSEVYSALQQGVVDAQENPLDTIISNKFYEVNKYVAFTHHNYQIVFLLLDKKTYDTFTSEEKEIIKEAGEVVQEKDRKISQEQLDKSLSLLEDNGVTITEPDITGFQEKVKDAYKGYDPLMQEWIKKIQE